MNFPPIFSVSECSEAINQHLSLLGDIIIEGEISRIDIKNNRLIFITIKDKQSALDVFSLTHIVQNTHQIEEGMLVHVHGTAGLYKNSGRFRIFANHIAPHGEGALQIALEKLKSQLEAEGLFDESHKRPLPEWPIKIGLITAKGSSAYHDLVKVISQRMSGLTLTHLPVNVQGSMAIPTIKKAFHYISHHPNEFDLIIIARGGGSLEDLAAFNSEDIARLVFSCKVPIISAIGHEDDWSLTDYTADMRASTPSNAAELAVKDKQQVFLTIDSIMQRVQQLIQHQIALAYQKINQNLHFIHSNTHKTNQKLNSIISQFNHHFANSLHQISTNKHQINQLSTSISSRTLLHHSRAQEKHHHLGRLISSLSYQNTLQRGYSITHNSDGKIIRHQNQVNPGTTIQTTLHSGKITSKVTS